MDKGFHTGRVLVDLQKAIDMLDHTTLLQKMECIGFKESVIKWFQSHLSNRIFFVTLGNGFSDAGLISCGKDKDKDVEKIEKVLNNECSSLCE